jgi:carbamoyl-phosphate synthase large subunit
VDTIRVAITGAGSIVGQGIIKALRLSELPLHLIATDIAPSNSALYRADEGIILPRVEEAGSLETILERLSDIRVDVIMIGSEFDLEFFSRHRDEIEDRLDCVVIASPPATVEIADDKWLTTEFLRESGLPYAEAFLPESCEAAIEWASDRGFPVVLKTRRGTSARHVHVVNDPDALKALFTQTPMPMLQELAGPVRADLGSEWTCSAFACRDGSILGPFSSRRTLRGGSSWVVEVKPLPVGGDVVMKIASKLEHVGSINVQLMASDRGVVPFELNARFSGTTPIRAHYGFNEPEMAIRSFLLGESISTPVIRTGVVMRYIEEVFLDGVDISELSEPFPRGIVRDWFR